MAIGIGSSVRRAERRCAVVVGAEPPCRLARRRPGWGDAGDAGAALPVRRVGGPLSRRGSGAGARVPGTRRRGAVVRRAVARRGRSRRSGAGRCPPSRRRPLPCRDRHGARSRPRARRRRAAVPAPGQVSGRPAEPGTQAARRSRARRPPGGAGRRSRRGVRRPPGGRGSPRGRGRGSSVAATSGAPAVVAPRGRSATREGITGPTCARAEPSWRGRHGGGSRCDPGQRLRSCPHPLVGLEHVGEGGVRLRGAVEEPPVQPVPVLFGKVHGRLALGDAPLAVTSASRSQTDRSSSMMRRQSSVVYRAIRRVDSSSSAAGPERRTTLSAQWSGKATSPRSSTRCSGVGTVRGCGPGMGSSTASSTAASTCRSRWTGSASRWCWRRRWVPASALGSSRMAEISARVKPSVR